jgi:thiol-disulfide isomerase/thioredoxin
MRDLVIVILVAVSITPGTVTAQAGPNKTQTYEVGVDTNGVKVLKGLVTRSDIEKDSSFKWFKQNYDLGQANAAAVNAFHEKASQFQMVIFFGTWCEDSRNLLPVFYRLADRSGYPLDNITLIGVDREKTTLNELHKVFHIINVPTFIVMHNGREVDRVVEYGKYGQIDKELGEIVSTIK